MRIEYPGAVYHIYARGNRRRDIFLDREDRVRFVRYLEECCRRQELLLHSYCLMGNHYHLLLETVASNLARSMHLLNGRYARCFNHRHDLSGHVFQGRYGAILVQKGSYLLELARYVALNPVRARIVHRPDEYDWSSLRTELGLPRREPAADVTGFIRRQFAAEQGDAAESYLAYVMEGISKPSPLESVTGDIALGSKAFVDSVARRISAGLDRGITSSQKRLCREPLDSLFGDGVRKERTRRDAAILDAVANHGYRQKEVATYLGLHPVTVCRILQRLTARQRKPTDGVADVKI